MITNDSTLGRRDVLRIGGFTISTAAVIAACGGPGNTDLGTSGRREDPADPVSTTGNFNDAVLLRTASSLHYSAIRAIDVAVGVKGINADVAAAATAYKAVLKKQAEALEAATRGADGSPDANGTPVKGVAWTTSNPVFDAKVLDPAVGLIGKSKTAGDDAGRLVHALVEVAAATHQFFVPMLSAPALRQAAMQIGVTHSRVAALLASIITPENIVSAESALAASPEGPAETTTTVQDIAAATDAPVTSPAAASGVPNVEVYQIPAAFGQVSAINIALGNVEDTETDKRRIVGINTLFKNSFIYENM